MAGLQDRILDKGHSGFTGVADAEFGLRDEFDAAAGEQIAEFRELAGVAAGQHDLHYLPPPAGKELAPEALLIGGARRADGGALMHSPPPQRSPASGGGGPIWLLALTSTPAPRAVLRSTRRCLSGPA